MRTRNSRDLAFADPPLRVNSPEPLLALRVAEAEFALEPGRVFALGDSADCDFHVRGHEPGIALFVRAEGGAALVRPADQASEVALRPGSRASLAGIELAVVEDLGGAMLLPVPPALRPMVAAAAASPGIPGAPDSPGPGEGSTFVDLMARELRRAPWFLLSAFLHVLALLVLWLAFGHPKPPVEPPARYGYVVEVGSVETGPEAPIDVPVVIEQQDPLESFVDPAPVELPPDEPANELLPTMDEEPSLLRIGGDRLAPRMPGQGEAAGEGSGSGSGGSAVPEGSSGGFRRTVADLRARGLEIVFAFDSTGSMGSSITATKEGIAGMLEVLHRLVPHARFSLVTYRDRGAGEEYCVRSLPLSRDYFAAVNFMQSVEAEGGGDAPEAVLSALVEATTQRFSEGARRVIVLAGDAPPHPREIRRSIDRAKNFANVQGSVVHALTTGNHDGEVRTAFQRIATAGHGLCMPIEDKDRLLQTVLTLAFGREFEQDISLVQQTIAKERASPPTWARDLSRRGGAELLKELEKDSVSPALVHALVRSGSATVLDELVDALQAQGTSAAGRNAIAHVLQKALDLPEVPVDPLQPRPVGATEAMRLRKLVQRLGR